jgi:hypothetical protein
MSYLANKSMGQILFVHKCFEKGHWERDLAKGLLERKGSKTAFLLLI